MVGINFLKFGTIVSVIYLVFLVYVIIQILLNTHSTPKTLAYILLVIIVPIFGSIIYFSFGLNIRQKRANFSASLSQEQFDHSFLKNEPDPTGELARANAGIPPRYLELIEFLRNMGGEYLREGSFHLLINGEAKFPDVLMELANAHHSIHMEYYAWENDVRGNQVKEILLKKAKEGVRVRVMYDDYASRNIKKNIVRQLKAGGVIVVPKIKVKLVMLANRVNHRDHRKIIIIDGRVGFVGGINVSDRYDNSIDTGLYWRDTHVKLTGAIVKSLQRHFLVSWNASNLKDEIPWTEELFPSSFPSIPGSITGFGQVVAGGPIYPMSNIMLSYFKIFSLAREKLYITNPYFIPNDSILDALKQAALSGVDVRLLLPEKSDSVIVGAASRFYFEELLETGVKIYLYRKGFVHAKTVVSDGYVSVVGTANMDIRSFDLNFEIMSILYGKAFAGELEKTFLEDLEESIEIDPLEWKYRSISKRLAYASARLISAFL